MSLPYTFLVGQGGIRLQFLSYVSFPGNQTWGQRFVCRWCIENCAFGNNASKREREDGLVGEEVKLPCRCNTQLTPWGISGEWHGSSELSWLEVRVLGICIPILTSHWVYVAHKEGINLGEAALSGWGQCL